MASWKGAIARHRAWWPHGSCTIPPLCKKSRATQGHCCSRGQSSTSGQTRFSSACLLPPLPIPHTPPSLLLLLRERHFLTLPHGLPALLSHVFIKTSFSYFQFQISFPQEHYSITAGGQGGYFPQTPALLSLSNSSHTPPTGTAPCLPHMELGPAALRWGTRWRKLQHDSGPDPK